MRYSNDFGMLREQTQRTIAWVDAYLEGIGEDLDEWKAREGAKSTKAVVENLADATVLAMARGNLAEANRILS